MITIIMDQKVRKQLGEIEKQQKEENKTNISTQQAINFHNNSTRFSFNN